MEWRSWMEWLIPILSAVLSGSGIWALLSARAAGKATERAAESAARATEHAASLTAGPPTIQANTADWSSLMGYWQAEMTELRGDANRLEVRVMFLEKQREEDLEHIAALEQHIWNELPPPPPTRKRSYPSQPPTN